jgi:hypothetical protein
MSDIFALFADPHIPYQNEFIKNCDQDFRRLMGVTPSLQELQAGTRELVKNDPVKYHWCFYGKIMKLETDLKEESYVDERQKRVLDTFQFLSPVARAFVSEFRDSRYLRSAVYRYQKLSEWVFFRRLELSPAGTMELVQPFNPFGLWKKSDAGFSILEKYHIKDSSQNYTLNQGVMPSPVAEPSPVLIPSVVPSATPSEIPFETPSEMPVLPMTADPVQPALAPIPTSAPIPTPDLSPVSAPPVPISGSGALTSPSSLTEAIPKTPSPGF